MQVYIELALLENFCMDFTLLYAAKAAVKNPAKFWRIALGAAVGAGFAVAFPLFNLTAVWGTVVKVLSGLLICLISGRFKKIKPYVKFCGAFFVFTAILGGALIGIFSLAGTNYLSGEGYILSSVPVGVPMFAALLLIIGAKRLAVRLKKTPANEVTCRIYAGQLSVEVKGFFDSGNKVYCRGAPVSVIPVEAAQKIIAAARINEGVKIHTVAGSRTIRVFTADKMEIDVGEKTETVLKVKLGISPRKIRRAVLHCDLLQE